MSYLISTTSTAVSLKQLGIRASIPHPTTNLDLMALGYTKTELDNCTQLQDAINAGLLTATYNGNAVIPYTDILDQRKQDKVKNIIYVQKNPGVGEFSSIAAAVASISGATFNNPFLVVVGPGTYVEPLISVGPYTSVYGDAINSVIVQPDAPNHHVFDLTTTSEISYLTVQNAGSGYAAVASINGGDFTQVHKVSIHDCDIGILHQASTVDSKMYIEYVDINGTYTCGIKLISTGGKIAYANAENCYCLPVSGFSGSNIIVDGSNADLDITTFGIEGATSSIGIRVTSGGELDAVAGYMDFIGTGVFADTTGTNPTIFLSSLRFKNCTTNFNIANATATGNFSGASEYAKEIVNPASTFFITNKNRNTVTVSKQGADFTSIKDAVDSITTATAINPYVVSVDSGVFTENTITMKPYVFIEGSGMQSTTIVAASATQTIIVAKPNSSIENVRLTGATGVGGIAISGVDFGSIAPFIIERVMFGSNETQIFASSTTAFTLFRIHDVSLGVGGVFTNGIVVQSSNPTFPTAVSVDTLAYLEVTPPFLTGNLFSVSGTGAQLVLTNTLGRTQGGTGNALVVSDGAEVRPTGVTLRGFDKGLWVKNVGAGSLIRAVGLDIEDNTTWDVLIEHPNTGGGINGQFLKSKVSINSAINFPILYADTTYGGGFNLVGDFLQGTRHDRLANISSLVRSGTTTGIATGGDLSYTSGLVINVASGTGYLIDPVDLYIKEIVWGAGTATIPANTKQYIYIDTNGAIQVSPSTPIIEQTILLGEATANATAIDYYIESSVTLKQHGNRVEHYLRDALGAIFESGSIVSENVTPFQLNASGGKYHYGTAELTSAGGTGISWETYYQNGSGGWTRLAAQTLVDHTHKDTGTGTLVALTPGYYAKHSFYMAGDSTAEKYFLVISQSEYPDITSAQAAALPNPPSWLSGAVVLIASIVIQEGASHIAAIRDERPRIGYSASAVSTPAVHANLLGLNADDHPGYLPINGVRGMSGVLNMGTNNITNAGTVNGVTVQTHASRHTFTGADALSPALAGDLAEISDSTAAAGTNNTVLPRADHVHPHGNRGGGSLHAAATTSVNGFMSSADKTKLDQVSSTELSYVAGVTSAIQTQLGTKENTSNKSDNTALGNSTTLYPTQNAVKTYVDNAVVGLLDDRGNYNASSNLFPSTGGSGTAGAILKGDLWFISVAGTLGGVSVKVGDHVRALVDSPGQTASNWSIGMVEIGYVAENQSNKSDDTGLSANSSTLYPTQHAVKSYADTKVASNVFILGGTNTKITYDAKGLVTAGATAQLASADFANQGTTSTVLHGNAAGNPSFSSVVDADIGTHTSTKITITNKAQLNSNVVYKDQTNTFGAFDQVIPAANLKIVDATTPTKVVTFDLSGQTASTTTTIANLNTTSQTLQIPAVTQTEKFAVVPQASFSSVSAPAATSSTIGVMMGLAASITPRSTGRVNITICGTIHNATNNRGGAYRIYTGTGTAPVNGAAITGTAQGILITSNSNNSQDKMPFMINAPATSLTLGTTYWIDISLAAAGGTGTVNIADVTINAIEF